MPEECASMRSMARWVLPVLVGPSTAVTPAPRARASRLWGAENETGISDRQGIPYATERTPGGMVAQAGAIRLRTIDETPRARGTRPPRPRPALVSRFAPSAAQLGPSKAISNGLIAGDSVPYCDVLRRRRDAALTSRTSLERIAAESLTRFYSDFVHAIYGHCRALCHYQQ